jgi:hypothetical protein
MSDHPEDWCQRCARPNPIWYAPNDLWNKYARGEFNILCPCCFIELAKKAGFDPVWVLKTE